MRWHPSSYREAIFKRGNNTNCSPSMKRRNPMMVSAYPAKKGPLAELLESGGSAEDICKELGITYPTLEKWVATLVQEEKKFFPYLPI
jgi:hypothetical protein